MTAETGTPAPLDKPGEVTAFPEPESLRLRMPVDVRNMSLLVLALLASLFVLSWAKAVFIPIMLSLLFSYALSPPINWLEAKRVPRWLSSAVLLLLIVGSINWGAYSLRVQATQLLAALPEAAEKLGDAMKPARGKPESPLESVQKAATKIEEAASETAAPPKVIRGATRVVVEKAAFNLKDYLWTGTLGLVGVIGQAMVVLFLTYFLMVSGETFRRKLVKLTPTLSNKKITVHALNEITEQIQRYLQVQLLISVVVGVLTGLALLYLGLENAAVWGVVAFVLNFIPYVGSVLTAAASALVAFLQFGSFNTAMAVGGASLFIHTVVGNLLTPWLTSQTSRLSPVAVFMGLLVWGWLWGAWGLLLGVPIFMIVKSICDRIEDFKPIGEFLGS